MEDLSTCLSPPVHLCTAALLQKPSLAMVSPNPVPVTSEGSGKSLSCPSPTAVSSLSSEVLSHLFSALEIISVVMCYRYT
ncbi:hypothetical protein FKM82_011352 [Ascaphus truei]